MSTAFGICTKTQPKLPFYERQNLLLCLYGALLLTTNAYKNKRGNAFFGATNVVLSSHNGNKTFNSFDFTEKTTERKITV